MASNKLSKKIRKGVTTMILFILKPFAVPLIILLILIAIVSSITDILYIAFSNDDKIDMKEELKYYNTVYEKEKDKSEVKGFFSSVWNFVSKIFGKKEISDYTDWPVERTLYNKQ